MTQEPKRYALETNSSDDQLTCRRRLSDLYQSSPLPLEHLVCNFGLYTRSSVLVKTLVLNELYELILPIPGIIMEFGTWWGQNLVMFENLRAIYEPFNKTRRILGFDTYQGYAGFSDKDRPGLIISEGGHAANLEYPAYLRELLEVHEGNNVMGHLRRRHDVIVGDVSDKVPAYFNDHPETVVALAYFDMELYEPTKAALLAIRPHLMPGSVILLDEFTWSDAPGEAIAFKEVFRDASYSIRRSRYTAERAIIVIK